VAFAESIRSAVLFLIIFNRIYAGDPEVIKNHPGVRCCGRRGGLFWVLKCSHRERQKAAKKIDGAMSVAPS